MRKVILFLKLNKEMRDMLLEAYFFLAWGRILKWIPFSKVAPSIGSPMGETSFLLFEGHHKQLKQISRSIYIMSRYTFWESECLVKAYAAIKMLKRRQIEYTLYLGTAKDGSGKFVAHAWLRSGSFYITGREGMERFTVVQKFAKYVKGNKHGNEESQS